MSREEDYQQPGEADQARFEYEEEVEDQRPSQPDRASETPPANPGAVTNPQRFKRSGSGSESGGGVVIPLNPRVAQEQQHLQERGQAPATNPPNRASENTGALPARGEGATRRGSSRQLHEQPPEYDYGQLLEELEKSKPFIPRPNPNGESSLGNLLEWGRFVGGKTVIGPISRFMDLFDNGDQRQQPEYMSWSKKQLYRLGGAFFLAWSAFLTQAVTNLIFVDANQLSYSSETFFQQGWFGLFNVTARTFLTALVFTSMLSYFETMLFDEHKSPLKKWLIVLAFVTDIVINTVGWITLWNHNRHFEWNPAMSLFYANNPHFEWGSLACEIFALFNAVLPEMCWFKARNAVTNKKKLAMMQQHSPAVATTRMQERGMYLKNRQGQDVWVTEGDLRRLAEWQQRQQQQRQR